MAARMEYYKVKPDAITPLFQLEQSIRASGLDPILQKLVKIRVSQINNCAFCVDMHMREARELGEDDQRIGMIVVWREATCFSDRERAALAWAETVTLLAQTHVPDHEYETVREEFTEEEVVDLTMAIIAINSWNRLAVSFRAVPGTPVRALAPAAK